MKRILIINSDQDTLELLESWLERKKYDVKITKNIDEVTGIIGEFKPRLIIIDVEQREIVPAIKDHDSNIPLLLMSGYAYRGSYPQLPVNDVIEKPFSLEELQNKVDAIIGTAQ